VKPCRWLALEGALGTFTVAVIDGNVACATVTPSKSALERGLGAIDDALAQATLQRDAIDALAVGVGPGSFTGLRIAVTYAKGLALALGRPLIGVSSYDVLADPAAPPPLLAVVSGRTGIACARLRTASGDHVRCGTYAEVVDMVVAHLTPGLLPVHGTVEGVAAGLGERGFTVRALPSPDSPALVVARLAARRFADAALPAAASAHDVRPDYGELPAAAVRSRRA
jgi:tRNA threonylcarbamoyladenosine biosynthesis protein TsaB